VKRKKNGEYEEMDSLPKFMRSTNTISPEIGIPV
jgi:hypothetical protein